VKAGRRPLSGRVGWGDIELISNEVNAMFNRILVAIDDSDYSRLVIPTTMEVARKFQSEVFVLHVSEHDRGRAAVYSTETPAEATRLVADAVRSMHDAGISVQGEVHDVAAGHVAKNIVETADQMRSELIVMGSRGLSDVQGLLLGSVTHKVMQLAPIPVLVARGPIPAKVKAEEAVPVTQAAGAY
jgi:nucleotide-binding universal stress UspA family protein